VPELDLQAEDGPVVVEPDPHMMFLAPLVGGGDEVLVAVLHPLDLAPEQAGGPRHQHLLGVGVDDLGAEPAAHVRGDHVDGHVGQAEDVGDRRPHPGGGLGGGAQPQTAVLGVPAGVHAPAL
jgi:hypothetical protein